jgi:hypothetical protein
MEISQTVCCWSRLVTLLLVNYSMMQGQPKNVCISNKTIKEYEYLSLQGDLSKESVAIVWLFETPSLLTLFFFLFFL